jgi:GMP synthase-like glutamine amidotransferase
MREREHCGEGNPAMRVVCLQHIDYEGPDKIADWAAARGHALETVIPLFESFPDVSDVDMLVVLGGPMGAYEDSAYPWLAAEKRYIAEVAAAGRRVLGVCLGAQLVAVALGGTAYPHTVREVGWFPVRLTNSGRYGRSLSALPETFLAALWHGDTYDLPEGMKSAASSDACDDQAFETENGRVVGVQFHLEWTTESLVGLVQRHPDWLAVEPGAAGPTVATATELLSQLPALARGHELLYALLDRMEALA